jgi:alpha-amylase
MRKVYRVTKRDPAVEVAYAIVSQAEASCAVRFGVELNLTLLAGNDPQRYYERPDGDRVRLHERGQCPATDRFSMVDEWSRLRVTLRLERPGEIWYMPVETVSQSEDGIERTYQGSALLASWLLTLQPGASEQLKVRLEIADI